MKVVGYTSEQLEFIRDRLDLIPNNSVLARIFSDNFNSDIHLDSIRRYISRMRTREITGIAKPIKRLFFDIETSPNIALLWRTGYNLNVQPANIINERKIICISYKWQYSDKVHTLKWDKNQCDKKMIIDFAKVMAKADEIVGHNSDRFDEKWLRTRAIFHRIPMLPKYKSIDTLKKAKAHFNFQSNSLKYIADFLGVNKKGSPGGLETWKKIMFSNDKEAMKDMVTYCEQDVIVLEDVFSVLNSYIYNNTNYSNLKGGKKYNCVECSSDDVKLVNTTTTQAGSIKRMMQCNCCDKNYYLNNKNYLDYLSRNLNP